jgi:hypothetical protein
MLEEINCRKMKPHNPYVATSMKLQNEVGRRKSYSVFEVARVGPSKQVRKRKYPHYKQYH